LKIVFIILCRHPRDGLRKRGCWGIIKGGWGVEVGDFDHARVAGGWVNVLVVVCGGREAEEKMKGTGKEVDV
jgi:hypothetical protein